MEDYSVGFCGGKMIEFIEFISTKLFDFLTTYSGSHESPLSTISLMVGHKDFWEFLARIKRDQPHALQMICS